MTMSSDHPAHRHQLSVASLPTRSSHGLPLANGLLGALIWAEGEDVIVSLDRTDLWDLSDIPEFSGPDYTLEHLATCVDANDMATIAARYEAPYHRPAPTKLPAGRIRIVGAAKGAAATLWLNTARAHIETEDGAFSICVCADQCIGVIESLPEAAVVHIEAPAFGGGDMPAPKQTPPISVGAPKDLNYPPPNLLPDAVGFVQTLPSGGSFCVRLEPPLNHESRTAYWTISKAPSPEEAVHQSRETLVSARSIGAGKLRAQHEAWWANEWSRVSIDIPDQKIARQWTLDAYKLIAAARIGAPPVALQGPWTSDDGLLPPWKGDYHHDLNTQMTYWSCLTGNRQMAHRAFLDWLWDTREACRSWTRSFFGLDGLNVPMTADIRNRQIGGWAPYTHQATTGAWLAQHFLAHWRYTRDEDFLHTRALPYVSDCARFLEALTDRYRRNGVRALRLSSSPEIHNNSRAAWFDSWTNYDLSLAHAATEAAAELAEACGDTDNALHWRAVRDEYPSLAVDPSQGLLLAPGRPLSESHRHFSHLMALHPLRIVQNDDLHAASLAHLKALGTRRWMGYSFAWMAAHYAAVGWGDDAASMLHRFVDGFTAPNSFHTNGEVGGAGWTDFPFEAFTLEGNCAAMAAVQDMMLQSQGDLITLFPALPSAWREVRFQGLCAEGAITIDAQRQDATVDLTLRAKAACVPKLRITMHGPQYRVRLSPNSPERLQLPWPI
jgi:alpha-L-fucosidase 2